MSRYQATLVVCCTSLLSAAVGTWIGVGVVGTQVFSHAARISELEKNVRWTNALVASSQEDHIRQRREIQRLERMIEREERPSRDTAAR